MDIIIVCYIHYWCLSDTLQFGGFLMRKTALSCAAVVICLASTLISAQEGYFANWFNRVDKTQAEQPHWITPLATTTPRLEEEFRYDIFWQTNNASITSENYGGAKGLELIPARHIEVILVAPPAYMVHNNPALADGFGDWGFLVKYRIISANEEHGNYILTAFFQSTLPTGQNKNG